MELGFFLSQNLFDLPHMDIDLMANPKNVPKYQATKLDPILLLKIFHKLVKCYFDQM